MFTGIIEEVGKISQTVPNKLTVKAKKTLEGTAVGDSIAVNGVCLTVTDMGTDFFTVQVVPETLRRSNLGELKPNDPVNLERALALGGRLGGHLVEGHVDSTGKIISLKPEGPAILMRISAPQNVLKYVVEKGFIAIDGTSLTVVSRDENSFTVELITHTRENTVFIYRRTGDTVNLEVDIIAKYVEALANAPSGKVTESFLKEHGFMD
ncbi:MAG TPA: riboflavin synthase [Dehalococcoidales bacterium]|nr:riboflavin synthase [Dehalococcoidales bacterium]